MDKEKLNKFFEEQQKKGAFPGLELKDLTEEQNQELVLSYLGHLETKSDEAKEAAEKANGENEELNKALSELSARV